MESSITTFGGLRCTRIPRTVFLTAISTSAASSEIAGLPENLSSTGTSTATSGPSIASSSTLSVSQPLDPASIASTTALVATAISASSTITAAASILPAVTSSNTSPVSTQISGNSLGNSTTDDSKKHATAVAIGASLGAVTLVALVVLFVYLYRRKRSRRLATSFPDGGFIPWGACGCGITGLFPSLADLLSKIKQKLTNKAATKVRTKVQTKLRAVVARIWNRGSMRKDKQNDKSAETQAEIAEKGITHEAPLQTATESHNNNNISSSPPRIMPHLANPFSDPPRSNTVPNESNRRPENQLNNLTESSTPADDSDEISISLPLTVRNVVDSDSDDNNSKKKTTTTTNRHSKNLQSRHSGSTSNLLKGRGSSPLLPDFKSRLENWRRDLKSGDRTGDRTSAHSDPFDLERPLTAHPTSTAEQQKF